MRRALWLIIGALASLCAIGTVVLLASHFAPIVTHDSDGTGHAFKATWALIGVAAGGTLALLVVTALLAPRGVNSDDP